MSVGGGSLTPAPDRRVPQVHWLAILEKPFSSSQWEPVAKRWMACPASTRKCGHTCEHMHVPTSPHPTETTHALLYKTTPNLGVNLSNSFQASSETPKEFTIWRTQRCSFLQKMIRWSLLSRWAGSPDSITFTFLEQVPKNSSVTVTVSNDENFLRMELKPSMVFSEWEPRKCSQHSLFILLKRIGLYSSPPATRRLDTFIKPRS